MTTLPRRVMAAAVGIFAAAMVAGQQSAYASSIPVTGLNDCDVVNSVGDPFVSGSDGVQAASLCQYLYPPNPGVKNTETTVNYWEFFGEDDWWQLDKTDLASNAGQDGLWSIPGTLDFSLYAYMIVFKDGADTNLIAFLLNGDYASGSWISPFVDPPFEGVTNAKDVSNFAIYRAALGTFDPPPPAVPEPQALMLLGIGLFAVAARMRRNRRRGA